MKAYVLLYAGAVVSVHGSLEHAKDRARRRAGIGNIMSLWDDHNAHGPSWSLRRTLYAILEFEVEDGEVKT